MSNDSTEQPALEATAGTGVTRRSVLRFGGATFTAAAVAPILSACGGQSSSDSKNKTLTIWWNKGLYPAEDAAVQEVAKKWQDASGTKVSLQFIGTDDIVKKLTSAITVGNVPDVAFSMTANVPLYAWQDKLVDLSDVVKSSDIPEATRKAALVYNQAAKKQSYYALPIAASTVSIFASQGLMSAVGMPLDGAPSDWNGYWNYFADAQKAYRAKGDSKTYAAGWPVSSSSGGDVNYDTQQLLMAFGVQVIDDQGRLTAPAQLRDGIIQAMTWMADFYRRGNLPPGCASWNDTDNNTFFLNGAVLATPNSSLSIPNGVKTTNPAKWNDIKTMPWPKNSDGSPAHSQALANSIVAFKAGHNVDGAKSFLTYLAKPENLSGIIKGGQGRFLPTSATVLKDPFFSASADPNIRQVAAQLSGLTTPAWYTVNTAYKQVESKGYWGQAWAQILLQKRDVASVVDDTLKQIQQEFAKYNQ